MIVPNKAVCVCVILILCWTSEARAEQTETTDSTREIATPDSSVVSRYLREFCCHCHGVGKVESNLNLSNLAAAQDLSNNLRLVEQILRVVERREMPPMEAMQPLDSQREELLSVLKDTLDHSVQLGGSEQHYPMRRMNRFEYANAVRDLFELQSWVYSINDRIIRDHSGYFRPETGVMPDMVSVGNRIMGLQQLLENRLLGVMPFPKDPPAENGFNNRSDHLSLTPVLMQSFLELSRSIVQAENFDQNCGVWSELFEDPLHPKPKNQIVDITNPDAMVAGSGFTIAAWIRPEVITDSWQTIARREDGWRRQLLSIGRTGDVWGLWIGAGINGEYLEFGTELDSKKLADGQWHHVAGGYDGMRLNLYLDGDLVGSRELDGELSTESKRPMEVGSYNGREMFRGDIKAMKLFNAGLTPSQIEEIAQGNSGVAVKALVGSWPKEDVKKVELNQNLAEIAGHRIQRFLTRAFRSPPDIQTFNLYSDYFESRYLATDDFTLSMKDVVSAALASPRFLLVHNGYRDSVPNRTAYNLATRLSFFLWSSIPDTKLIEAAESGDLLNQAVLGRQVDRMLNDPKVKNFCDSFAPQWLRINNLVSASPDFELHRDYYFGGDDKISYKRGMHMMLEPLLNFETVFIENRSLLDLIDSDFTYRSHLLSEWYEGRAATYPINVNLRDIEFTRVPLKDKRYGGVITTSAIMVMTSSPIRSLPITRGAWVSSVIFNDPPKPPPDNVPALKADDQTLRTEGLTVRDKLQQHSRDIQCVGCHRKIDPLGFVLENYDLLGRWRDRYRTGLEVDASGQLFGEVNFQDVIGFKEAITNEKNRFVAAFVQHLLSYALGRELTWADRLAAEEIVKASGKSEYRMRDVIRNLVIHPIFSELDKK